MAPIQRVFPGFALIFLFAALWAVVFGVLAAQPAAAQDDRLGTSGLSLPRFVSLKSGKVNLRTGPGKRYPIDWIYRRRGLPVEVIDEFETWRRIRDHEGTMGWVHQSMLDGQRSVLVKPAASLLRRRPESDAAAVALLEPGVIAYLEGCEGAWCQVTVERHAGWLRRAEVFGLYPRETLP